MLVNLSISNVILINQLVIEFKEGLCALTGETGAGKSILLDSLGLALGMRSEKGLVRKGQEFASVTASFQVNDNHESRNILSDADIIFDDDILLLRRVVYANGKSRAFINDQPVSIALLKQVGSSFVEIHGQFETQGLLNPQNHRSMLDIYAGIGSGDLDNIWNKWKSLELELYELEKNAEKSRLDEQYLRDCLDDLDKLSPQIGEESELSTLRESLKHREVLLETLALANSILSSEDDPVQKAWAQLDKIADKAGGDELEKAIGALCRASLEISEASAILQALYADLQDSNYNLEEIDDRLYALRLQARKHNCSIDDLPDMREKLEKQLLMIENADELLKNARQKCTKAREDYINQAQKVSDKRKKTALKLNDLVQKELAPLKLEKARFITRIEPLDEIDWGAHGIDRVRFLVATNQGQEAGAINKIASGGEMSRFMLALKVVIAQKGSAHCFIFDEVDAGIGGATAHAVGERLARLARDKQVLVVTHAPQVAARANNHWVVRKGGDKNVKTDIIELESRADRCEEIARMLAGANITIEAKAAADKLLDNAA